MMRTLNHFLFGTLRGRLIVSVAAVHAVLMALFVTDLTLRQRAMLLDRQAEEATALSQALATSAAGWIAADDIAGLQELADAQRQYPELLFAIITDAQGRVLARSDHFQNQKGLYLLDLPRDARQAVLAKTPALVDVATPAQLGNRHVGWIRVGIGQKANAARLAQITKSGVLYALAAISIGSIIAWVMGHRITRRLHAILKTINQVRAGDGLARAPVVGSDEAAVMAKEFNAMLEAVAGRGAELRASEDELRRLTLFQQTILTSAAYSIVTAAPDGIITGFNPAAERLLGYTAAEVVGRQTPAIWHDPQEIEQHAWRLSGELGEKIQPGFDAFTARPKRNLPEEREWTFIRKDGTRVPVNLSVTALRDHGGHIIGFVGMIYDITERKQAREVLQRLNEELEQGVKQRTADLQVKRDELQESQRALMNLVEDLNEKAAAQAITNNELTAVNKELESFSYSVSHDLRAPLRAIDGFSKILLEDYADKLDEEGKDSLQRVRAASQRMGQLIDDLLQLSRHTRSEIHRTPVDLSALARAVADELQKTEPERRVEFVIEPGLTANADTGLIRAVLENLIGNAWKFSGKQAAAKIEFGRTTRESASIFYVRDDGVGFNMDYADKLFGAFQRLHSPAEFSGTGIGLATVQRIIHRHGGRVWAEGKPNQGATFYFTLSETSKELP